MRQHLIGEVVAIADMLKVGLDAPLLQHIQSVVLPYLRDADPKPVQTPELPRLSDTMLKMVDTMLDYQTEGSPCGDYDPGSYWYVPSSAGRHAAMRSLVRQGLAEVKTLVVPDYSDCDREVPGYGLTEEGLRIAQLLREKDQGLTLHGRSR
jgi:hypothetical protein